MIDMAGQKFGRLTVIKYDHSVGRQHYWLCRCECGKETVVRRCHLLDGNTKSCGCYNNEVRKKTHTKDGVWARNKRLYKSWNTMLYRCENKKSPHYKYYGGRGISVCKEWHDSAVFEKWALSNGYSDDLTIDRIDVNGNYCPENCRWISQKEQCKNKRNNRFITIDGVTKCLKDWIDFFKISKNCFRHRISKGFDEVTALKMPLKRRR